MPSRTSSSLGLTSPTKDFDYMPSHRSPRRRHSFSMLPGSRILPFSIRSSTAIEPFISPSAHATFKFTGKVTPTRVAMNSGGLLHPPGALKSPATAPPAQPVPLPAIQIQTHRSLDGSWRAPGSLQPPAQMPPSQSDPPKVPAPAPSIEDKRFAYCCVRAVKLATAAMLAIQDQESFLRSRIKEEEMMLEMLHEEVEHTQSRTKTAVYQVASLREGIQAYGVNLPDGAEIEALIRQPSPEPPQSPITPTQTPPTQLFQQLLFDMLDHSPALSGSSSSSHTDLSHYSRQPQINLSSSDHTPCSPVLEGLSIPLTSSDQGSSTSTFLTAIGGDCISEIGGRRGE